MITTANRIKVIKSKLNLRLKFHLRERERGKLTVFFEIATRINGLKFVSGFIGGLSHLEGLAFDDVRSARSHAEQVGVGDETERLVVLNDAGLTVPLGKFVNERAKLWREREGWLEQVWVLLWEAHSNLCPRSLVLPS